MSTHCFTSISFSYLNRARVLGRSIKKHNPNWKFTLLVTDVKPEGLTFDLDNEPFDEVVYSSEMGIDDFDRWCFMHDVIEVCTAVKGPFLKRLLDNGADKVFYIDPDIAVFHSLDALEEMLETNSVLLTPHQLEPDYDIQSIYDNEIGSLKWGTYNLGFVGVSNDTAGMEFAKWWEHRCLNFCFDEVENGLFVDQKWCDLAPALFDNVKIIRDPGYNVASWNLNKRTITIEPDGEIFVNKKFPLRFYHFTKLGPVGDEMTRRYAGENIEVFELWAWYKQQIINSTDKNIPEKWWFYGSYDNGEKVSKIERKIYRNREDIRNAFTNPFQSDGFYQWVNTQGKVEYPELG